MRHIYHDHNRRAARARTAHRGFSRLAAAFRGARTRAAAANIPLRYYAAYSERRRRAATLQNIAHRSQFRRRFHRRRYRLN